jgi:hypothetical protein
MKVIMPKILAIFIGLITGRAVFSLADPDAKYSSGQ